VEKGEGDAELVTSIAFGTGICTQFVVLRELRAVFSVSVLRLPLSKSSIQF